MPTWSTMDLLNGGPPPEEGAPPGGDDEGGAHQRGDVSYYVGYRQAGELVLGYWAISGFCLGQHARLLLEFARLPFSEVTFELSKLEDGSDDLSAWRGQRDEWGLDFPNLPFLIDGAFRLTESSAIFQYIAELGGLRGSTPQERARTTQLYAIWAEVRGRCKTEFYYASVEERGVKREPLHAFVAGRFGLAEVEAFAQRHGVQGAGLVGDSLLWTDILWADLMRGLRPEFEAELSACPALLAVEKAVNEHPISIAYFASQRFLELKPY